MNRICLVETRDNSVRNLAQHMLTLLGKVSPLIRFSTLVAITSVMTAEEPISNKQSHKNSQPFQHFKISRSGNYTASYDQVIKRRGTCNITWSPENKYCSESLTAMIVGHRGSVDITETSALMHGATLR